MSLTSYRAAPPRNQYQLLHQTTAVRYPKFDMLRKKKRVYAIYAGELRPFSAEKRLWPRFSA
jgi:hypothetical protein